MKEENVRALVERLYLHVAAMPWADSGFTRSTVALQASQDHIVNLTVREIMELSKNEKTTNSQTASE